ncbi:vWA domain-containing protein [Campylobacter devanensis]|uniref:vWA domain-containing protein n=1 Tax=Campylobacter devanensis TaxID=3161138 RepID=UPI000A32E85E|nr:MULTISPECIES: VWA domain-containing protein [unclassified Campylobacter]
MAFDPSNFVVSEPKSIPVLLLLDVSGSMSGDKIDKLNTSVRLMIDTFKKAETNETFIKLAIITFGARVDVHTQLQEVSKIENFTDLSANGATPLGVALKMSKAMIEDKEIFKGRDYRPAVVLVSDGEPNDEWESPLRDFVSNGRTAKCDRLAIAIGDDADLNVLSEFIEGTNNEVLKADDAKDIVNQFKKITMSVTMRMKSVDKNQTINITKSLDTDNNIDFNNW